MTVINTNVAATISANAMKANQRDMSQTMERLSTGLRVNSAKDDAAGLAIGTRMDAQIKGLNQAARNANDGISMVQTVDSAASEMTEMFQRMRELAVQAQTGTLSTSDKANLNGEFAALAAEVDRLANDTTFNGIDVMNSGQSMEFAIGADEADTITVALSDFNLANGGGTAAETLSSLAQLIASEANLRTDLASGGTVSISDGTNVISIDMNDVIEANQDGSLVASTVTSAQVATALNAKAAADDDFTGVIAASGTSGLALTQKVGQSASSDTYTLTTSGSGVTSTSAAMSAGTTGSLNGALGANLSAYSNTASVTVSSAGTIAQIDTALDGISTARATLGSTIARLEFTVDSLQNASLNNQAAKSRIMDADYAAETTELARSQIIAQASTAMLSQANQQSQTVLALLK